MFLLRWRPAEFVVPYYCLFSGAIGCLIVALLIEYPTKHDLEALSEANDKLLDATAPSSYELPAKE